MHKCGLTQPYMPHTNVTCFGACRSMRAITSLPSDLRLLRHVPAVAQNTPHKWIAFCCRWSTCQDTVSTQKSRYCTHDKKYCTQTIKKEKINTSRYRYFCPANLSYLKTELFLIIFLRSRCYKNYRVQKYQYHKVKYLSILFPCP